ncbi:hypothetical protein LTR66_010077, partial [Elasticomyces elasticus]
PAHDIEPPELRWELQNDGSDSSTRTSPNPHIAHHYSSPSAAVRALSSEARPALAHDIGLDYERIKRQRPVEKAERARNAQLQELLKRQPERAVAHSEPEPKRYQARLGKATTSFGKVQATVSSERLDLKGLVGGSPAITPGPPSKKVRFFPLGWDLNTAPPHPKLFSKLERPSEEDSEYSHGDMAEAYSQCEHECLVEDALRPGGREIVWDC